MRFKKIILEAVLKLDWKKRLFSESDSICRVRKREPLFELGLGGGMTRPDGHWMGWGWGGRSISARACAKGGQ